MKEKKLSHDFWYEDVMNFFMCLQKSNQEFIHGSRDNMIKSQTHIKLNKEKLYHNSESMILLGCHTACSYKLYNPLSQRVVPSKHVTINEQELEISKFN